MVIVAAADQQRVWKDQGVANTPVGVTLINAVGNAPLDNPVLEPLEAKLQMMLCTLRKPVGPLTPLALLVVDPGAVIPVKKLKVGGIQSVVNALKPVAWQHHPLDLAGYVSPHKRSP